MSERLCIVGAGNIAEAIARGLLRSGRMESLHILAIDPSEGRRSLFNQELGTRVAESVEAINAPEIVLLSVKPQQISGVLASLVGRVGEALVVSVAAGVRCATIESVLGPVRVVRAMPNTPLLIGCGATALAGGTHASSIDLDLASQLFGPAGVVVRVDESQMDAVTAVSGSGPAYFFFLVEQLIDAAVSLGLDRSTATTLARQTALGAGRMLAESDVSAEELRRRVTSPGGTTQAAIEHLESHDWPAITRAAVAAAEQRGRALGQK